MNWNNDPGGTAEERERERLLQLLDSTTIRQVAICKMEGATNEEIATAVRRSVVTVERLLAAMRIIWQRGDPR